MNTDKAKCRQRKNGQNANGARHKTAKARKFFKRY